MKIREINTSIRKSWNYQTFESGELITLEDGDDPAVVREESMSRCRSTVTEQIKIEKEGKKLKL